MHTTHNNWVERCLSTSWLTFNALFACSLEHSQKLDYFFKFTFTQKVSNETSIMHLWPFYLQSLFNVGSTGQHVVRLTSLSSVVHVIAPSISVLLAMCAIILYLPTIKKHISTKALARVFHIICMNYDGLQHGIVLCVLKNIFNSLFRKETLLSNHILISIRFTSLHFITITPKKI